MTKKEITIQQYVQCQRDLRMIDSCGGTCAE